MKWHAWPMLHLFLTLATIIQGLLIIGPQKLRPTRRYTMVMSNFLYPRVDVSLTLTDGASGTVYLTKTVNVLQTRNQLVEFDVPDGLEAGGYTIILAGQRGFTFYEEIPVVVEEKSFSGLIQLDKPIYKPGETVNFRVIVVDSDLKPPQNVKSVSVVIENSKGLKVRKWDAAQLQIGVFEDSFAIETSPELGTYKIAVTSGDEVLVSKTFEVKEFVLSAFDVEVFPTTVPLEEHQGLNLTISAKSMFGKPVSGKVELTLFITGTISVVKESAQVNGVAQLEMRFNRPLMIYDNSVDVNLNLTFTEYYTNRLTAKSLQFTIYKSKYIAKLIKQSDKFLPDISYKATVKVEHRDGSPARFVNCFVEADGIEEFYERKFLTDGNGEIPLVLTPSETDAILIMVSVGGHTLLEEKIEKAQLDAVKIALNSRIQQSQSIKLEVTCKRKVDFLVYFVLSMGNVIDHGFISSPTAKTPIVLNYSDNMVPKAKVFVASVVNNTMVYDIMDIVFPDLLNNFDMEIEHEKVKPGEQIQLKMIGRPGSYVALAAYDKSLLQYGSTHDLHWSDVQQLYDSFYRIDQEKLGIFQSIDLFTRVSGGFTLDTVMGAVGRAERLEESSPLVAFKMNFVESFLWRNTTMDGSGRLNMTENTPNITAAWCLTGFSMHPVYGLGIIKHPLQLKTVKEFYIIDHLPYSMKLEEAFVLQFTIYNNLGADYDTEVTLFNFQDQMEFVEEPSNKLSHSKVLTVQQTVGVFVSFLVKAKKLGEMVVRVKASNMLETDVIEKVIRVLPKSLVEKKIESRIFCQDSFSSTSFTFNLNVDEKADPVSQRITFTINPNLLPPVPTNLGDLLSVSAGCGEQNMMLFVPNVVVLDYLKVRESKDMKLMEKATSLVRQGYRSQMVYLNEDGSFGALRSGVGSVFLTAFVAKSMQTAAKYINEVDTFMIARAFDWLASKQHSSGRFDAYGPMYHYNIQGGLRNGIALTSYVLIAFMENEKAKEAHQGVVAKGIEYVANMLPSVTDLYDLSIATYALMLNNHPAKHTYLQTLVERSKSIENGTMTYWARQPHEVETTAYALMAMILNESYKECLPVMRWLANQSYVPGSFSRTQDTFVGLKALTKIVEKISPSNNSYNIDLEYKKTKITFAMSSLNLEPRTLEEIPSDVRKLTANVAGVGFGLLSVKYEYTLDSANYSKRFDLKLEKIKTDSDDKLQLKICASFIPKSKNNLSNMALVEVNFPRGYVMDDKPISNATTVNPIKNIEIRFGATSVVAYYDNMGTEKNCFHITAYRRFKVYVKQPAYVIVYDYYDPKLNAIQLYELDPRND